MWIFYIILKILQKHYQKLEANEPVYAVGGIKELIHVTVKLCSLITSY